MAITVEIVVFFLNKSTLICFFLIMFIFPKSILCTRFDWIDIDYIPSLLLVVLLHVNIYIAVIYNNVSQYNQLVNYLLTRLINIFGSITPYFNKYCTYADVIVLTFPNSNWKLDLIVYTIFY